MKIENRKLKTPRIGIYAGTFNPVHAGHIGFALQALEAAKLDYVYFMPERRPRYKTHVEHFGHRVAMLRQAAQPHPKFGVLEMVDVSFSVDKTLPRLKKQFPGSKLVFLFGSDIAHDLPDWPNAETLLNDSELVVGIRAQDSKSHLLAEIDSWDLQPKRLIVFDSFAADVSAGRIRDALRQHTSTRGLLTSVERYSNRHWLYVSLA